MGKYIVIYALTGSVEVEADSIAEAEDMVLGDGNFTNKMPMSDTELIDGLSRSFGYIDGDAMVVVAVEELKEEN